MDERAAAAREELFRRFMAKVRPLGPGGCWQWEGTEPYEHQFLDWRGQPWGIRYGSFAGRAAHRASYEFFCGPIPEHHVIHHHCGNGGCVNPAHLEALPAGQHVSEHGRARCRATRQRREEAGVTAWSLQMLLEAVSPDGSEGAE